MRRKTRVVSMYIGSLMTLSCNCRCSVASLPNCTAVPSPTQQSENIARQKGKEMEWSQSIILLHASRFIACMFSGATMAWNIDGWMA